MSEFQQSAVMGTPPGQQRRYSPATRTGIIPFTPPGTDFMCETSFLLWGDLRETSKPPLIYLHGGPGSGHTAHKPLALLNQDYSVPVILYDQLGCGKSTHLRERKGDVDFWTFDLFIAELRHLLEFFGILDGPYDLLGQSWGGMLAVKYALSRPKGLRKLILSSAPAVIELMNQGVRAYKAQLPQEVREVLATCEAQGTTQSPEYQAASLGFFRQILCRLWPFPQELTDSLAAGKEDDTVYSTLYGPSTLNQTGPLKDFDLRPELHLLTSEVVPGGVLLLSGDHDPTSQAMIPFSTGIRAPVRWVRFHLSGHVPVLEETEKYLSAVAEFIEAK